MARPPLKCPQCGEFANWNQSNKARKGFSIFWSILGAIILWPVGILAGFFGKKRRFYQCHKCGFSKWY